MKDERWYDLVEQIRERFRVLRDEKQPAERGPGHVEVLEFEGPMGRMRLERLTRPAVKEVRTRYSRRAGSSTTEEYVYEEGEFSHRVILWRWDGSDWVEQDFRGIMG